MAVPTRLRGKQGFTFTLKIGAGSATSYADSVKSFEISSDDADDSDLTFTEAAAGLTKQFTFSVTGLVSFDTGSLFAYLWANPGATFLVDIGPWGNTTASTSQPHFTFTAQASGKPVFSNEASTGTTGAEFDYDFTVVGDITAVTA